MQRNCIVCGSEFDAKGKQKTCSDNCHESHTKDARRRWNETHKDYHKLYQKKYYQKRRLKLKELRWQQRLQALKHYGGDPPKCACCGESEPRFLEIDHINNNGNQHRKIVGKGRLVTDWLIKNNFPLGFQILCSNCNRAKGIYGICPHQTKKEVKTRNV